MPWPETGATQYHAQLGLPDKGRAIGLVVCNSWDLEPWDLLNGLALGCYQPYPEVLLVSFGICRTVRTFLTMIYKVSICRSCMIKRFYFTVAGILLVNLLKHHRILAIFKLISRLFVYFDLFFLLVRMVSFFFVEKQNLVYNLLTRCRQFSPRQRTPRDTGKAREAWSKDN